jgi:hypothetical protein
MRENAWLLRKIAGPSGRKKRRLCMRKEKRDKTFKAPNLKKRLGAFILQKLEELK